MLSFRLWGWLVRGCVFWFGWRQDSRLFRFLLSSWIRSSLLVMEHCMVRRYGKRPS